jgi:hypothetical protein
MTSPGFTHRFLPDYDLILHSPSKRPRPTAISLGASKRIPVLLRLCVLKPERSGSAWPRSNVGFQPGSPYRLSDGFDSFQPHRAMRSDRSGQAPLCANHYYPGMTQRGFPSRVGTPRIRLLADARIGMLEASRKRKPNSGLITCLSNCSEKQSVILQRSAGTVD